MTISSRTPEGLPHHCVVCGNIAQIDISLPSGDSCCPSCGQLLWWFRDHLLQSAGVSPERITPTTTFGSILTSLDDVELVMELEEYFDITIPDDAAERMETVADAIRYISRIRRTELPE